MKIWVLAIATITLVGCVHDQSPYAGPPQTFEQYYAKQKGKDKEIAGYGYTYGRTQMMQELDAAYRAMQAQGDPKPKLRKSVVALPTKQYTDPDGVKHDAGYILVEKVELVDIRPSNGRTLYIVK